MKHHDPLSISFQEFVRKNELFDKKSKLLLSVSGGLDSNVLMDLLLVNGFKPGIVHVNYNLRADSGEDEELVRKLANSHNLEVYVKTVEPEKFKEGKGESVQMKARQIRYDWFNKVMKEKGYDFLLTAHHMNDNVETLLLNLGRGTGIRGLRGIHLINEKVVRPLLFATKKDLNRYATLHNIQYREDSSNALLKYDRNIIRHKIIPEFEEMNPSFIQRSDVNIKRFLGMEHILEDELERIKSKWISIHGEDIHVNKKMKKHPYRDSLILYELFKNYGFQFGDLLSFLSVDQSGKKLIGNQCYLLNDRLEWILVNKLENDAYSIVINKTGEYDFGNSKIIVSNDYYTKHSPFGANPVFYQKTDAGFLFNIRSWEKGDYFFPKGMKGRKTIKKYFTDKKIPLHQKKRIPIVCSRGKILGILGFRMSRSYIEPEIGSPCIRIEWVNPVFS